LLYALCALLMVFAAIAFTLGERVHLKDAAFGALVAAFPNTGFMGVPLLVALIGPAAAGPMICTILVDLFVTTSLCIALAQVHDAAGQGTRVALARALRGALSNPMPWSIAAGALFSLAGIPLAGPPEVVVRMLADAASPVALFTIGAVLCRAGRHAHTRTPLPLYLPVALMKLFLHPLLAFALLAAAMSLGAPLSAFQLMVVTLTAALPSASNVAMLAERYGADNGRVTRIIMSSTVLAFASFSLLAWAFGVQPKA
jgi:predicted permease